MRRIALRTLLVLAGLAVVSPLGAEPLGARPKSVPDDAVVDTGRAGPSATQDGKGALRPGALDQEPTKIPSRFLKSRTVAPHSPDIAVPVGERTTIGVFQDTGRSDARTGSAGRQSLELGAGLTLQHRFGGQ